MHRVQYCLWFQISDGDLGPYSPTDKTVTTLNL